jgi:hypothetical protein
LKKNVKIGVTSCDFNSYENEFNIGMSMSWNGGISGTFYQLEAMLTVDEDGHNAVLEETWNNENLKDLKISTGLALFAVITVGILVGVNSD